MWVSRVQTFAGDLGPQVVPGAVQSVLEQLGAGAAELYTHWGIVLPLGVCTSEGAAAVANMGE